MDSLVYSQQHVNIYGLVNHAQKLSLTYTCYMMQLDFILNIKQQKYTIIQNENEARYIYI